MSNPNAVMMLIIRHGEKPADSGAPHGVDIKGDHEHLPAEDSADLIP